MIPNPRMKVDLTLMEKKRPDQKLTPDGQPIPPGWHDVMVAKTRGAFHQVVAKDDAIPPRTVYLRKKSQAKQATIKKESRFRSFMIALPKIVTRIKNDFNKKEEAKVLDLIYKTGFRVDSGANTRAKNKAYGASGLLGAHVKVEGNTLNFLFPSKKSGTTKMIIQDPVFANKFKNKEPNEKLFDTDYRNVTKYWKSLTSKYLVKDLRLYNGTDTAIKEIDKRPVPTTIKEYKQSVKEVVKAVSDKLQNTPAVAKKNYILSDVWVPWDNAVKSLRVAKVSKKKNPIEGSGIPWLFLLGGIGIWWFLNHQPQTQISGGIPPPPLPVVNYTEDYREG